eukprot:7999906-Karenia_brevis.AAC.1
MANGFPIYMSWSDGAELWRELVLMHRHSATIETYTSCTISTRIISRRGTSPRWPTMQNGIA